MRRRNFLSVLGGAVAWPAGAHAQRSEPMRRVGLLMTQAVDDPELQSRIAAFVEEMQKLGWTDGRNIRFEFRSAAGDANTRRKYAAELIALGPDAVVAAGSGAVGALLEATRTIPIVFANVLDPVGAGFIESLARPGGNITGFTNFDYGMSGKWLELLREIAPRVTRAMVLRDPGVTAGIGQWGAIQTAAPSVGLEVRPINVRDASEIERAITAIGHSSSSGLIVTGSALALVHRNFIIALAARNELPAVYPFRVFASSGGLMSYGPDILDPYRRVAGYVDRILKGEKPADLPVQAPTKYELVINLKTAKTLGLDVPPMLLARADEVIE